MAMKNWKWNHHLHMMVPANTAFDINPDVKVADSCVPFSVDLSVVDKLRELDYLNNPAVVK